MKTIRIKKLTISLFKYEKTYFRVMYGKKRWVYISW